MYTNPNPTVDDDDNIKQNNTDKLDDKLEQDNEKTEISNDENSRYDIENSRTVYFVFIDILGFKELFSNPNKNEQEEFIYSCREIFNYYFELIDPIIKLEKSRSYAGQTSDSLYFYTENIDALVHYIRIFSNFCLYSMTKSVFFRGGIAKGSLFTNEDYQFYGQSVINAYMLESEIAKNPIIVIDEKTNNDLIQMDNKDFIKTYLSSLNSRKYINPFACIAFDKCIDPELASFELNFREIDYNNVCENIENGKIAAEFSAGVYPKYEFLSNQFKTEIEKYNKVDCVKE